MGGLYVTAVGRWSLVGGIYVTAVGRCINSHCIQLIVEVLLLLRLYGYR